MSPDEVFVPNVILEPMGILDRMGMGEYAGGNIANEDFPVFGLIRNSNHLSARRIHHLGSRKLGLFRRLPPDDAGYTTRLEVPANNEWRSIPAVVNTAGAC